VASASQPSQPRWPRRLLQEPLFQFLVLGIVLFGAYRFLGPSPEPADAPLRIELTADDLRQLAVMWLAQGRPAPTRKQMQSLVEQKVAEEILSREAVALGLDQDDQIIKRRLAQKMDFLLADLATLAPPTTEELRAWFATNGDRFAQPPHMSFRHLYFSLDRHGAQTREAAAAALGRVAGLAPEAPQLASIGDPFMFRNYYGDATPEQMGKEFGPDFAAALFRLKPGSWQGPVESGYGWHLIWVDSFEPGRVPDFAEVAEDVKAAWIEERYREVKRRAFEEMRSRYTVVVAPIDDVDLENLKAPPAVAAGPVSE
jgi:peptidyl-prolyl cis-trans isomerase C